MEYKILNDINDEIRDLRVRTFVIGRGVPEEIEMDGKDPELLHFCIYEEDKLLAYLRAEDIGDMLHIGRVCVEENLRKQGLGRKLLEFLENYAKDKGFSAIELSAVDTAVGFYEKLGFVTEGEYYLETGVPHIYMKKACF